MTFVKTAIIFMLAFPLFAVAENEPNEFGYFIKKSDIRSLSRQVTELRHCSQPNCKWVKLKNQSKIWAIKGNEVPFAEYLEHYLKSPADSEHFFFINKNYKELVYTSLYGHAAEEPASDSESPEGAF